ncbi:hypothetical protein [Aestuariivirga sp.]|uniref:hypothetical protein n=1 Tax=Aestuariivirga sp. TaxID=2650926 RepID=UPI0025C659C6|nr:hypothetical protein [Aestuariivirga sp.]MCA3555050.1 hypothetical protein [Aestuariivirga sp.]
MEKPTLRHHGGAITHSAVIPAKAGIQLCAAAHNTAAHNIRKSAPIPTKTSGPSGWKPPGVQRRCRFLEYAPFQHIERALSRTFFLKWVSQGDWRNGVA